MVDLNTKAARYLTPPEGAFWRWSEDGDCIEWVEGPTIAFRSEIAAVLARLTPLGLPAMDVIVLLLAACRDSWDEDPRRFDVLTGVHTLKARISAVQWIRDTIEALDRVNELPGALRQTPDAKAELAAFVLETHPLRTSSHEAEEVCRLLNAGFSPEWPQFPDRPIKAVGDWIRELRGLFDGLQRVNEEDVRTRFATGLDQIPRPVPDEEETVPQFDGGVRELLDILEREDQFRGLVRLTRNLMAVTHLPRAVHESDDLSLGGVSDISNRGPLDRLLLSELANDDDTLTVRVALNEALYLRRERPPATPPREIVVLLDSGLRMWGVPRVYATAVALSLSATADDATDVRVYRAAENEVQAVDLTTREGLIEHLAALDPRVHPGESLPAFCRELGDAGCDVMLVTGEDVLADREFRRQLAECELPPTYIAALGREGEYRLVTRSERGERTLREAMFSLDELFGEQQRPATPLIDESVDPSLPAILRLRRFPLRLPHSLNSRNAMLAAGAFGEQATLAVTRDRRLMLWDVPGLGARQIAERLPARDVLWWHAEEDGNLVRCVIGRQDLTTLHLATISLSPLRVVIQPLPTSGRGGHSVCGHGGALFVVRRGAIEVFDVASGQKRPSPEFPSRVLWRGDRFFADDGGWYALSFDGLRPHLELVVDSMQVPPHEIAGLIDVEPAGSPLAVLRDGNVFDPTTREFTTVDHGLPTPVMLTGVGAHGATFSLKSVNSAPESAIHECLVTLTPEPSVRRTPHASAYLSGQVYSPIRFRTLRVRWRSIAASHEELALISRRGDWFNLVLDTQRDRLQLRPAVGRSRFSNLPHTTTGLQSRREAGYELRSTELRSGSRAVLDSRGLLHFQSRDRGIPEFTLVLHEQDVAGWCADGRMWGPEYFVGNAQERSSAASIWKTVIVPFLRSLR